MKTHLLDMHLVVPRSTVWCLTPFSTLFQLCRGSQCTYPCFPGVLLTSTPHNIFSSHWLLSHITLVDTTDSGERGMNPVLMTVISFRIEYWPSRGSNQRPPFLKSATPPTELWGSAVPRSRSFAKVKTKYYGHT